MIHRVLMVTAIAAAALTVWAVAAWRTHQSANSDARICQRVNILDDALIAILGQSFKALPALPYYEHHPAELARALRSTQRAIDQLEAARCI